MQNNSWLYLVVMAGGSGTRFWPKSTSRRPKQLLAFGREESAQTLLAQTLERFDGLIPKNQRYIVTTRSLEAEVRVESAEAIVLAEPQARNTAPGIYWAAREIYEKDPHGVMVVVPSDQYVASPEIFRASVAQAADWATAHEHLVTLGVKPTRPETGFGYLKVGAPLGGACVRIEAFIEKPDLDKATAFVEEGNYLWNGGMYMWRVDVILAAFDKYMPEMKKAWNAAQGNVEIAYPQMTATSIDYGVMEKADQLVAFQLDCGWDDLGSWTSLENLADVLQARTAGGVVTGGDMISVDSENNIVDVDGHFVALLGVRDLIIVEQNGALLVAAKDRAHDIRKVVERVKKMRPDLA